MNELSMVDVLINVEVVSSPKLTDTHADQIIRVIDPIVREQIAGAIVDQLTKLTYPTMNANVDVVVKGRMRDGGGATDKTS